MRYVLSLALTMFLVGSAMSAPISANNQPDLSQRPIGAPSPHVGREGGETIATAFVIPGDVNQLPYHDTGNTCNNVNDYDEVCGSTCSTSPDVVYSFTPSQNVVVNVSLCASAYDTKLYVYESPQSLIACNEDACEWSRSFIYGLALTGGVTYHIVVDGDHGACGTYDLILAAECVLACPAGALVEGEPPCGDGHEDLFNGGCWSPNLSWSPIEAGPDGCVTVCGKGCTWLDGFHRDTDWYEAIAAGGPVTVTCQAEFPLLIVLDLNTNCGVSPEGAFGDALPCSTVELSQNAGPGEPIWLFVAPLLDDLVPESNYVFTMCGLAAGATPVKETSWGRIKHRYR